MKNYEIKSAVAELSLKQKVAVGGKRIAYLVPNMYNRVKNGFVAKAKALKASMVNAYENTKDAIVNNESVQTAMVQAQAVREERVEEQVGNYQQKIERKEEAVVDVKANENVSDTAKSYIIKAYESDIERLHNKQLRVSNSPKRLLISTAFIGKLVSNWRKKRQDAKMQRELEQIPQVEETNNLDVEAAKEQYLVLNDQRLDLLEQINAIQNQMQKLVKDYGLTREMFEEQMTR